MNYTAATTGISELKYQQFNLVGSNFNKLGSTPVTILPAISGVAYIPFNVTVSYVMSGANQLSNLCIGFETLLGISENTAAWAIPTLLTSFDSGIFSNCFSYSAAGITQNVLSNASLILWQQVDNAGLNFSKFTVNILYLQVTNL